MHRRQVGCSGLDLVRQALVSRRKLKESDASAARLGKLYSQVSVLARERLQVRNTEYVAPDPGDFSTMEAANMP